MAKGEKTGGRQAGTPNKANAELREFAGRYTIEAVKGLHAIARDKKVPAAARVGAWREILDRAVGKAPQALTDQDGNRLFPEGGIVFQVVQAPNSENQT